MEIVVVVIRDKKGRYFVHQRREDKNICPNLYALGVGGRVEPGEEVSIAAQRELMEEAGITDPIKFLFSMDIKDISQLDTVHVHELVYEGEMCTFLEEWKWSGWMTEGELDKLMEDGKLCPETADYYKRYKNLKK